LPTRSDRSLSPLANWNRNTVRGASNSTARKLQEETLNIRRRVLGPEHPATSTCAWNIFRSLRDLGELAAGLAVLKRDLLWLLNRDAASLGADQRTVRQ
jgi:hypothetical protein